VEAELAGRPYAVDHGHAHIHQHHVRPQGVHRGYDPVAVSALADDLESEHLPQDAT